MGPRVLIRPESAASALERAIVKAGYAKRAKKAEHMLPDVSNEAVKDKGVIARAVDTAETFDGVASNVGSAASLMARVGLAAPTMTKVAGVSSKVAGPALNAALQGVDAARLLSPEYRKEAAASIQNMADDPSILDSKYFNTSAALQALGRAPSTIYSLAYNAAGDDGVESLPASAKTKPLYDKKKQDRLRDVPEADITRVPSMYEQRAAAKLLGVREPTRNLLYRAANK